MPDGTDGGVTFTLDGAHLRVDARPARLVSMLRHGDGAPVVTAQPSSGDAKVEQLPDGARQATFQVRDDVTVEATQAATFVAVADDSGRCLVIAYSGELTVVPGGDDRFALGAEEALVISGTGAEPAVVPVTELSAETHPEVAALLDATTDALFAPAGASTTAVETPSPAVAAPEERTVEMAPTHGDKPADGAAKKAAPQKNGGAKKAAGGAAAAGAGAGGGGRRKKGKKGRPQPQKAGAAKKTAAAPVAAAAGAAAAGAAAGESAAKKAPAKATGGGGKRPPREPAKTGGGGSGGGGGHDDDSYEDTPRDRRFLVGAVLVALVLAVGAVLLLSQVGDDDTEVATGATTTTVDDDEVADTTTSSTTPATTTTAPASTTTTARATTTTARATTTTAPAPQPKYSIEPKSCVQNGNTITYTASVKNDATVAYDFTVDVSFKTSDGTEVAKGSATVSSLGSGRTADFSAAGTSSRTLAGTGASCEVTRVDARPSD